MTVLYGWDMSHYDSPAIGNAVGQGIGWITHKAGGDTDDPEIAAWWSGVRSHRITVGDLGRLASPGGVTGKIVPGAYWVLYPGNPAGRADAFLARLDATCAGWRNAPFVLQVDCEMWNNDPSTQPGKSDIKAFCDRLRARVPGFRPIVYASRGQYGNQLTGLGYPLWNADYPSSAPGSPATLYAKAGGNTGPGWHSYSGQTPNIWQFSSTAIIGGQTTSDANAYRGTLADLILLTAPGWENDVATLSDADIDRIVTAIKNADINPDPKVNSSLSGSLWTVLGRTAILNQLPGLIENSSSGTADAPLAQNDLATVLAGMTPAELGQSLVSAGVSAATLAKALPDDLAREVAGELAVRFAAD